MTRPEAVTGLEATPELRTIILDWKPLSWSTVVDHYRVYATEGDGRDAVRELRGLPERLLVAKTVYPQWQHRSRAATGETWSYLIVTVDAAGAWSRPSAVVVGRSKVSIIHSGDALAVVGDFDGRTLELQYAPKGYTSIPTAHPDAVITVTHGDDAADHWPYLLPGPGDAWAGNESYSLDWTIDLAEAPEQPAIAIWLVDTTRLAGRLDVMINGDPVTELTLITGGTQGSRQGDANLPGSPLIPSYYEFDAPPEALRPGTNTIRLTLAEGGWVAWDAVGLYDLA